MFEAGKDGDTSSLSSEWYCPDRSRLNELELIHLRFFLLLSSEEPSLCPSDSSPPFGSLLVLLRLLEGFEERGGSVRGKRVSLKPTRFLQLRLADPFRSAVIMVNRVIRDDPSKGQMHNRQALSWSQFKACLTDVSRVRPSTYFCESSLEFDELTLSVPL